ncbi:hypothetical protein, partial [Klebsiella pneumoniae]|uniref:hypothetical protein n=1 Tax=Klebsiella pneumoniae TaxID=573 RepID=UPI001D112198
TSIPDAAHYVASGFIFASRGTPIEPQNNISYCFNYLFPSCSTGTNFGPAGSQGVTSTAGAALAFQSLTGDTSAAIYHNADSSV